MCGVLLIVGPLAPLKTGPPYNIYYNLSLAHVSIGTALPLYGEVMSIKHLGTQVGGEYKTPRHASGRWVGGWRVMYRTPRCLSGFSYFYFDYEHRNPKLPKFSVNTAKSGIYLRDSEPSWVVLALGLLSQLSTWMTRELPPHASSVL